MVKANGATAGAGLRIHLLGDMRVERAGESLALPASKRTRALFGYLVTTETPQTRQHLCDLLWDGPDDPRAALRWSLSKLRPLVDDGQAARLEADRDRVAFRGAGAQVDVDQVHAIAASGPAGAGAEALEACAALFRGEFLDGLELPSCPRFHQWCMAERERLGAVRRSVLAALIERLAGEPERALPHARALVATDPLAEGGHAALVRALAAVGRPREAEEHAAHARAMLERELAAPPTGELARSLAEIRRARLRPATQPEPLTEAPGPATDHVLPAASAERPPLIGRVGERERIATAFRRLRRERPERMLLFMGEPGIGKTRLLEEVAGNGRETGALVLAARAFEAEMIRPYGCWIDALAAVPAGDVPEAPRRDLAVLMPAARLATTDDGDRARLFAGVVTLITGLTAKQAVVLTFDDLQWIDEASASLLHYVLRSIGRATRFLFAGAARLDEIDDNTWAKRLTQSLIRDGALSELRLPPLSQVEIKSMLSGWAPEVDADLAYRAAGGNPLLTVELVRSRRRGLGDGGHSLDGIVERELSRLDAPVRELILYASAMGREFRPEVLADAIGASEGELLGRLHRLERRGLLQPTRSGGYDFAHDLVRQAIYGSLSQARRRLIHRQIVRALQKVVCDDESLNGDLAHHAALAEDHLVAARAALAAGERCLRMFANTEAAMVADRGLAAIERLPAGRERTRLNLMLLLVKMTAAASPGMRSVRAFPLELQQAVEAAEAEGFHSEAAKGFLMLSWLTYKANATERTWEASLAAAKTSLAADDVTRCEQLANTSRCLLEVEYDVSRALNLAREAEELADALKLRFIELEWSRALVSRWNGDLDPAYGSVSSAIGLALAKADHWREYQCLMWAAIIAYETGQLDDVDRHCSALDRVAGLMGDPRAPAADGLRALAAIARSDGDADAALIRAIAGLREIDDKASLAYVLNQSAILRLDRSEADAAAAELATEALAAARAVRRSTEIAVAGAILARVTAARGNPREGAAHLAGLATQPGPLSARARLHLARAAALTGFVIPALVPSG